MNFTIGTVTAPELSDADGKTYYIVGSTAYEKVSNGANQIGVYAIKAAMSAADAAIWTDANVAKTYTANLSAAVLENSVNVKLLDDEATSGADSQVQSSHAVKFTISQVGAVTINQIEGTNATATANVNGAEDTSYFSNDKTLFAVRPRYDGHAGTISNTDATGPYTSVFFSMDTPSIVA